MKSSFHYFKYILVLIVCPLYAVTPQDTRKQPLKQQIHNQFTDIPDFFYRPLEYSDASFSFFFKRIYNQRKYPQSFLALNFIHILSGVSLAPQADQPRRYISKLFYLFDRKMQGIYINPYAFFELLNNIPAVIAPFCSFTKEKKEKIDELKECVGSYLSDHFQSLQSQPEKALNELATKLYDLTVISYERDISISELQHAFHYFLGRAISGLVWSPADQAESWHLVKKTAHLLEKCAEYSMLDEEMLDDLFWVILQRYAFFIDLCASDLRQQFFDTIYTDLRTEKAPLWCSPEREELITTKHAYLQAVLMEAEIKSRAGSAVLADNSPHA